MVCDPSVFTPASDRKWQYFIGISLLFYFGGIILIFISQTLISFLRNDYKKNTVDVEEEEDVTELEQSFYLELVEAAGILVSAQNLQGRILVGFSKFIVFY